MAKWKMKDSTGVSIGGEWYAADESGVVDVPDVWILTDYGFEVVHEEVAGEETPELSGSEEAAPSEVTPELTEEVSEEAATKKGKK